MSRAFAAQRTAAAMSSKIGRTGSLRGASGPLRFRVKVLDVREVYGALQLLVEPIEGTGAQWVDAGRVDLDE